MEGKANIFVVEDENVVAQDIMMTLKRLGYSVVGSASTGKDAVEKIGKTKPDLVLMDIGLKGEMNGLEVAEKISGSVEVPVVFLTAYVDDQKLQKAKSIRAFGYIVKPFEEKNLNTTIQMALHKFRTEQDLIEQKDHYQSLYDKTISKVNGEKLDMLDRKILAELDVNSRSSSSAIGKKVSLSKGTVKYRIKRLTDMGYVNKFCIAANLSLLGFQYYEIFMRLHKFTPELEQQILGFMEKEFSCLSLRIMEGTNNLVLLSVFRNQNELRDFIRRFTQAFGNYLLEKDISNVTRVHRFRHRFLLESRMAKMSHAEKMLIAKSKTFDVAIENPVHEPIDKTDEEIIRLLTKNARTKINDISQKLRIDRKKVKYRIKRMEKRGILVSYTFSLDLHKLGMELVQVNMNLKDSSLIPHLIGFFNETDACLSSHEMLGKSDLSVDLAVKNERALNKILEDFRKRFTDCCINYDVMRVYQEYLFSSSPFG